MRQRGPSTHGRAKVRRRFPSLRRRRTEGQSSNPARPGALTDTRRGPRVGCVASELVALAGLVEGLFWVAKDCKELEDEPATCQGVSWPGRCGPRVQGHLGVGALGGRSHGPPRLARVGPRSERPSRWRHPGRGRPPCCAMKPIRLSAHARGYLARRGFSEDEVVRAIHLAPWQPAEQGRWECRLDIPFHAHWNGKFYATKQVRPIFVDESNEIVVITVYTYYF